MTTILPGTVPYCTCMRLDEPRRQPECLPNALCLRVSTQCACGRVKPEHLPRCRVCHVALSGERFSERVVV